MWRAFLLAALVACQPKQPLQASYFNADKAKQGPPSCGETLACYAKCEPATEECMLICDQRVPQQRAQLARAVTYCGAQHGCSADDEPCMNAKCDREVNACTNPQVAPAPSPMQPRSYPGQIGGPAPGQPQPYPGQAAAPMQPYGGQPYPGQPYPARPAYAPPPPPPPPPMQPQPYPGQPYYQPPPRR